MNFVRPINLSLIYERFVPSGCKDVGVKIFEFATNTQFLSASIYICFVYLSKEIFKDFNI